MRHGDIIILPRKYVNELRNLPEDVVSLEVENDEVNMIADKRLSRS